MPYIPDPNTVATTDTGAYRRNLERIMTFTGPGVKLMPVIKANAYGHGMIECATTALEAGASMLGVCLASEGIALREAGINAPVLVMGAESPAAAGVMIEHDLIVGLHSFPLLEAIREELEWASGPCRIHVNVDTGMGRLGLPPQDAEKLLTAARETPGIEVEGIFSHFPSADEDRDDFTRTQIDMFTAFVDRLAAEGMRPPLVHMCNSAGTLRFPEAHFDMIRPGIMTYGLEACPESNDIGLEPVLSWSAKVTFIKDVPADFPVSYGGTFRTKRPSRLATIPVGYAHGYRRILSNRAEALINGVRVPVAGRVCMDHTVLDVTDAGTVEPGDHVVLLGTQGSAHITAEELAEKAGTITYEIVTGITGRVSRTVTGST